MRKRETVVVPAGFGRDAGKVFVVNEMPATQAEKWALRAFLALKGTSGEVPPEVMHLGMVAVAWRGLNVFLAADVDSEKLDPLLDEMLVCVEMVRDQAKPDVATRLVAGADDVEEVQTLMWLRSEVLRVHTGFSATDALSTLLGLVKAAPGQPSQSAPTSPTTSQTS